MTQDSPLTPTATTKQTNKHKAFPAVPGADVQLAAVDDAGELEQDGEPASDPDTVPGGHVHVVAGVLPQRLHTHS